MSANQSIRHLQAKLSNYNRELELTLQINEQLEKIRDTSLKIQQTLNKLVYGIADLTDEELERLHSAQRDAQTVLKKHELRYQMLKAVQQNACVLAVTRLDRKSIKDKVKQYYDRNGDREDDDYDDDDDDTSTVIELAAKPAINGKVSYKEESESDDDRLEADADRRNSPRKSFSPDRFRFPGSKASSRKRFIPERFDATVRPYFKRTKRVNGME